jgi:hypothetical protein
VNLETLVATLRLDTSGFRAGMADAQGQLDGFSAKMKGVGATLTGIGQRLTLGVTAPILGMAAVAVNAASDLSEAYSAVGTVFGAAANQIAGFTGSVAADLGLSREQALSAAAGLGVFADAAGLSGAEAAGFSNELVAGAADLASFYNAAGGVPEVLADIRSGLTGETEPLRKYGILLNEAALQEYALANGIWDGVGAMTEQQKVLARHGFILANLGAAEGDFARTQGGLANSTRVLKAQMTDLAATLGEVLVPYVQRAVAFFQRLAAGLQRLSPGMRRLVVILALAAAAIGPLLIGLGLMLPGLAALGAVLGVVLSPIGLLIAAGVALAVLFRGDLARAIARIGDGLRTVGRAVGYVDDAFRAFRANGVRPIEAALLALGTALEALTGINVAGWLSSLGTAFDGALDAVRTFFDLGFDEAIGVLAANIQEAFGSDALTGAVVNGVQLLKNVFTGEWDAAWQDFKDLSVDLGTLVVSAALKLADTIWEGAGNLWEWVKRKLGVGTFQVGDATGGPGMVNTVTIGDVLIDGALTLGEGIRAGFPVVASAIVDGIVAAVGALADVGSRIWGAIQGKINDLGITGIDVYTFGTEVGGALQSAIVAGVANIADADWAGIGEAIGEKIAGIDWSTVASILLIPAQLFGAIALAVAGATVGLILGEEKAREIGESIRNAVVGAVAALDWAHNGGIFSKMYDSLVAGVAGIDWGAIPGQIASSLWEAIKAGFAQIASLDELVASILGSGGGGAGMEDVWAEEDPTLGKAGGDRRGLRLADATTNPFAALIEFAQDAAAKITNATLAIESRVTAMAGVVTAMGFNAGDGFRSGIGQGFQAAGAAATTITLGIESRLMAFAGEATVQGFNAGDGFAAGVAQGMARAVGAAQSGAGQIRGALTFTVAGQGYAIGASLAQGIANGIYAWAGIAAQAAANMVSGAIMAARVAGAIFSPSRTMADLVGLPLAEGVAVGLRRGLGAVEDAAAGLIAGAAGQGMPGAWAAPVPALARAGGVGAFGRAQEVHHHHYDFTGAVVGGDAEAWIARVSAREVLPAVGKALDVERRAQGMR